MSRKGVNRWKEIEQEKPDRENDQPKAVALVIRFSVIVKTALDWENKMTYKKFIEKHGEEEVKFSSYYKYSFTFKNEKLAVGCGGSHDDIYRLEVNAEPIKIKNIDLTWAKIGEEFYSFTW